MKKAIFNYYEFRNKISIITIFILLTAILFSGCTTETANYRHATKLQYEYDSETAPMLEFDNIGDTLEFNVVDQQESRSYHTITFSVTNNNSMYTFSYIKLKVIYLDVDDEVLTTNWTYAVSSEGLAPYESKQFDIMTRIIDGMSTISWELLDYNIMDITIPDWVYELD